MVVSLMYLYFLIFLCIYAYSIYLYVFNLDIGG